MNEINQTFHGCKLSKLTSLKIDKRKNATTILIVISTYYAAGLFSLKEHEA